MTASTVTCPSCTDSLGTAETPEQAAQILNSHASSCKGGGNPNQVPSGDKPKAGN